MMFDRLCFWLERVNPWSQVRVLRCERSAFEAGYRDRGREIENLRGELKCAQSYGEMKAAECDVHLERLGQFKEAYGKCCDHRTEFQLEIARLKAEKGHDYEDLKTAMRFLDYWMNPSLFDDVEEKETETLKFLADNKHLAPTKTS